MNATPAPTTLQGRMDLELQRLTDEGGCHTALVCTAEGLPVAATGEVDSEELAGITSLFDDIVLRAVRDLGMGRVDEVTMLDPSLGRLVIRPLDVGGEERFFLVVRLPARQTWRRNTNRAGRALVELLAPVAVALSAGEL